jgi:sulfonate transport system permease protein
MADFAYDGAPAEVKPRWSRPALPKPLHGIVLPCLLVLVWETVCRTGLAAPNLLPAPSAIVLTLHRLAANGDLWLHLQATIVRLGLGFAFGAAAGTLFGALTGASPAARQVLDPMVQGLRSVPSIAWVPLFILWFGIFETSKIMLIAVGVFFPVYLNLMLAITQVDRKLIEVGRIHRLSRAAQLRRILLPASLPGYITGLRSGLGLGWMFVIAAEMMGASEGVGFLLIDGEQTGRPALVIGALLLFALLGKASDLLLARIGAAVLRWQDVVSEG